ncbi:hypothetical protein CDN99_10740 [Roseateles aquatilis]|uniref:AMP-dependent synthetase/ligase domain-containing protein n=1 Tax=Roseateles aquatilis TaxID=431061 RepID=A0A246JDD9_9BURK|nr:fatty acyl-AMP ligase [Roseateles aquatilis]OWQ90665.1 hypothetical protein CDN99_10740 [Roseateles aquatilis]
MSGPPASAPAGIIDLLRHRAAQRPDSVAYRFIESPSLDDHITWGELARRAMTFARRLGTQARPGDRVLLALPPGIDHVVALFGCFWAGAVVVPTLPMRQRRNLAMLQAITEDCDPVAMICDAADAEEARAAATLPGAHPAPWGRLPSLAPSADEAAEPFAPHRAATHDLALLQYTSGSTGTPKGVMLTHGNLMHNLEGQSRVYGIDADSRGVIWLPPHHDMGLNAGILQPLHAGCQVTLMSPLYAMQRPLRWLQAISDTRATVSGGPSFAFGACIAAAPQLAPGALDLSSWRCAFLGAEQIHAPTMRAFVRTFAPFGLRDDIFAASYGLAESTVLSTCDGAGRLRVHVRAGRELVGCGRAIDGLELAIVDPETRQPRAAGDEGEIWLRGPSIAKGYWRDRDRTTQVFRACTSEDPRPWLRTGDLGVRIDDDLVITGRIKDLIIFAGRNLHAEDIEASVREVDTGLLADALIAAFATDGDDREELRVIIEVSARHRNQLEAFEALRPGIARAVLRDFDVRLGHLAFVRPGHLPRTSSGKVRRQACRDLPPFTDRATPEGASIP